MKETLSNIRMCVMSKERLNKEKLLKVTKVDNFWKINNEIYNGRSFYLKKDKEVISKFLCVKKHGIRYFQMSDNLKEELEQYAQNL